MVTFDKFDNNKKKLLEGLKLYRGIISSACEFANLDRQTFYNYKSDDEDFAREVASIDEASIDFVEGKLFEKINGITVQSGENVYDVPPSDTAIIFYLKTKGKKRGYVEKTELDVNAKSIQINFED